MTKDTSYIIVYIKASRIDLKNKTKREVTKMSNTDRTRQSWKKDIKTGIISIGNYIVGDAHRLFSEWPVLSDKKRDLILYGIQQRVSDKLAGQKNKTPADYKQVFESIVDGSFYQKDRVSRMTIKKKAMAIKDTLSANQIALLKKLGILD